MTGVWEQPAEMHRAPIRAPDVVVHLGPWPARASDASQQEQDPEDDQDGDDDSVEHLFLLLQLRGDRQAAASRHVRGGDQVKMLTPPGPTRRPRMMSAAP